MENILIPISPGELLDKISILQIKSERMTDPEKLSNVNAELALLSNIWARLASGENERILWLRAQLRDVNQKLWEIEEEIRTEERSGRFGKRFVELARGVYLTNDRRSQIKKELNQLLGSQIIEEKSYPNY